MIRTLLILTLIHTGFLFAGEKEFLELCKNKDSLPEAQRVTLDSLIKIGSGTFTFEPKPCEEVVAELQKIDSLRMHGGTFEYLFTEDLTPIATMDWIQHLDISGQGKTTDLKPLEGLALKSLRITNTGIVDFRQLHLFPELETVGISMGNFTSLKPLTQLSKLANIELLPKHDSRPSIYLGHLSDAPALRSIKVDIFPSGASNIKLQGLELIENLESLSTYTMLVDANDLVHLPLKHLSIIQGKLENHSALAAIRSMETLRLHNQEITDIGFLRNLSKLTTLDLHKNNVTNIEVLAGLVKLEHLSLGSNQVWNDRPIRDLSALKTLDLSSNRLSTSVDISKMKKLENLNLSYNHLYGIDIRDDIPYPNLKKIDLRRNTVRSGFITRLVGEMFPAIERLDLSQNKLVNVSPLATLASLEYLTLDDNKISDVSMLSPLSKLKRLSARYNLLTDLTCPVQPESVCDFLHQES